MKQRVKTRFSNSFVYALACGIRRGFWQALEEWKEKESTRKVVITLRPQGPTRGNVLFSYIIDGFLLEPGGHIPSSHTNIWQSLKMAETFVELGYEVDVIHYTNSTFVPSRPYSFLVDVRHNVERLAPLLNKNCIKIMHLDTAHILFHNAAGANRLLQLQQRRGVTLKSRRFEMPNLGIEYADYATATGNDFVVGTFAYAKKKIFKIPSPCAILMDQPRKDWGQCSKRFLWFSSSGLVHKGLDLALEAFKGMPECHLTVCAPVNGEKDFVDAYFQELYETPNIKTVGWVDIESEEFRTIANSCAAMIHLSCSEGGAPSVKTCMHAGLIPIVSCETGVDVHDFGFCLTRCSIDNIKDVISYVSTLSTNELEERTSKTWQFARRNYTRENFSIEYKKVILEIIEAVNAKESGRVSS